MLESIPSNWAELVAYVTLMCLCHLIIRLAVVQTGLPRDQNAFRPADTMNNYLLLTHCSSTSYLLGTIALVHVLTTAYLSLMFSSAAGFTLLGELPFFHASLSAESIAHWSIATVLGYSAGAVLVLATLAYQAYLAFQYSTSYGRTYCAALLFVLLFHATLWGLLPKGVHLHHWYCAWVYMSLLRTQDRLIVVAHAVATGIFLQGVATYGCAEILFNNPSIQ
ncbi:hypothetical protein PBRA_008523 [Plasmodiophora brassicae]|nr:hypothetical protein PBRA_008523 [Plasmodiophora brassicae]